MKKGLGIAYLAQNINMQGEWEKLVKDVNDFNIEPNIIECKAPLNEPARIINGTVSEGVFPVGFGIAVEGFGFRKGFKLEGQNELQIRKRTQDIK